MININKNIELAQIITESGLLYLDRKDYYDKAVDNDLKLEAFLKMQETLSTHKEAIKLLINYNLK